MSQGDETSHQERAEAVADALCAVELAIEDVDLNTLHDDDVRALLAAKDTVRELLHQYRQDANAARRERDDA